MAVSVRIEDEAFSDVRVELLGTLGGYNRFEALGRLAHLWRLCTQRQLYVISEAMVNGCLGDNGVEHLITCELAVRTDDGIRVKGTDGRIEWLGEIRATRQRAGQARAAGALRDSAGRLLGNGPAHAGHAGSSTASSAPAQSSAPAPAPAPAKEEQSVSGKPDPGLAFAEKAIGLINRHAGTKYQPDSAAVTKLVKALIKNRHTPEQAERVIASKRSWVGDPKMGQFFRPATLLAATNFATYLDDLEAGSLFGNGDSTMRMSSTSDDEPDLTYAGFGMGDVP